MSKFLMRRAVAIGIAACFVLIGAMSMAEAGRGGGGFKGGAGHIGGSAFRGGNIHVAAVAWVSSTPIPAASTCGGESRREYVIAAALEVPHQSRRQIRLSRLVGQIRQPPPLRPLPQIRLLPLVRPPALFIWRRVRLSLPARRGDWQRLLVGSVPEVQRRLLGLLLPALDSSPLAHGLVSPGCTATVCTLRFAALRGFRRCHETPKCLWWATFCAKSDGKVNAARRAALPQALRSATIGAGSTKDQQTP